MPPTMFDSRGEKGLCQARVNRAGKLYTENYGKISSLALDPMEKKPLYHFYPGARSSLSVPLAVIFLPLLPELAD